MNWTQVIDPFDNITLSAMAAAVPVVFIFWALIIKRIKGYLASLFTVLIAVLIAIIVYRMPVKLALLSTVHGAMYGLFPICWIIIAAVFLYNVTVKSGQFEIIKNFMASITSDRRLQALLIAFSFGSFLEGTAGFGTPVAITAAMLVGLGFNPLYAAGICLIANTAPVAFGGIGIPISVASQVSGIPEMAISQMVRRTLPFLSLLVPFYLVIIMAGFKRSVEVLPAIITTGLSFAFFQWFSSNYMGPMLPDVIASLASILCLMILLRFWKPKSIWRFRDEPAPTLNTNITYSTSQIIKAWSPFIILTLMIIAWGLQPVKDTLNSLGFIKLDIPGLHNIIRIDNGENLLQQTYKFNYLSASGTAILISAIISVYIFGMRFRDSVKLFFSTLNQLKFPAITIASILGFAYITNNSGMSISMAEALANTGILFPFFAPILGWLGVFITGSDTSSNALFSKLQYATASNLGVDPVVTVAANATGGVTGKMISPQSIAIGAASVGLVGKEYELFRFTVKHSIIMLIIICFMTLSQAYLVKWIIPSYQIQDIKASVISPDLSLGFIYLMILTGVLVCLISMVKFFSRREDKMP
jgi:lactate permease